MDPDFCMEEKATFYDEELERDLDKACNNGCDEDFFRGIEDFDQFEHDTDELLYPDNLNADQIGLAMSFGEMVGKDREEYDVDENTDDENWKNTMKLYPLQSKYNCSRTLSNFEEYINEITSGKINGPWRDN